MGNKIGTYHSGSFKAGAKHPGWKGGVTPLNHKIRHSARFRDWRQQVFERDDWTCVWCQKRGADLHPDHIKEMSAIIAEHQLTALDDAYECGELWDVENGRTLCVPCHGKRHGITFSATGNRTYRELTCKECKQPFKVSSKSSKKKPQQFCNRACYATYSSKNHNSGVFKKGVFYKSSRNVKRVCYNKIYE